MFDWIYWKIKLFREQEFVHEGNMPLGQFLTLTSIFETHSTLRTIRFYDSALGNEHFEALAEAFRKNKNLENVIFHGAPIKDFSSFAKLVFQVKSLELRHNTQPNISEFAHHLQRSNKRHHLQLEVFICKFNYIGDGGVRALYSLFLNLKNVELPGNGIGDKGATILAHMVLKNPNLIVLNLDFNDIKDEGARQLARAVKHHNTLRFLSLLYNIKITSKGALSFARNLQKNTHLEYFCLGHMNPIEEWNIFKTLHRNNTLKNIMISDMNFRPIEQRNLSFHEKKKKFQIFFFLG
jgi:Ran GTPase-activating protein (RanGAP) involved in mRNA processing and transport